VRQAPGERKGGGTKHPAALLAATHSPNQRDALADSDPLPSADPVAATSRDDFAPDPDAAPAVCHEPLASAV